MIAFDLAGRRGAVTGLKGTVHSAIAALLEANGAEISIVSSEAELRVLPSLDFLANIALDIADPTHIENFCRAAAEKMTARGGRILNIVSASGAIAVRGETRATVAAAAIMALTKALALEFAERRVLVNALAAGAIEGGRLTERLLSHVPLGRAGSADEIGRAALFLLDPENSYTTGHVMLVDGGWAAGYARNF